MQDEIDTVSNKVLSEILSTTSDKKSGGFMMQSGTTKSMFQKVILRQLEFQKK
jgi:hypothetical protein